jgi:predicted methyltransferase
MVLHAGMYDMLHFSGVRHITLLRKQWKPFLNACVRLGYAAIIAGNWKKDAITED